MRLKSTQDKSKQNFETAIPDYNDEQIIDILRKRSYYQPKAVELAMEEAFRRELINSEQDLFDEQFRVQPLKFKLFPHIEDSKNKHKIRKSIARGILISGIIPTIWGFLKINTNYQIEGGILVTIGMIWIFLSSRLIQQVNFALVNILLAISAASVFYVGNLFLMSKTIILMDLFIVVVLYGMLLYGLLFIRRLKQ